MRRFTGFTEQKQTDSCKSCLLNGICWSSVAKHGVRAVAQHWLGEQSCHGSQVVCRHWQGLAHLVLLEGAKSQPKQQSQRIFFHLHETAITKFFSQCVGYVFCWEIPKRLRSLRLHLKLLHFASTEGGSLTPVRDGPCTPRLRSVSSYGNIRAVTTARNLNKSLQNLSLNEECKRDFKIT